MDNDDPDLFKILPKVGLSAIRIIHEAAMIPSHEQQNINDGEEDDYQNDEYCSTPTAVQHKIPAMTSCPPPPPPPKKPSVSSRKRKLSEVEFFEIVNRDEVDMFFLLHFHR